jgi:hypothetical protein
LRVAKSLDSESGQIDLGIKPDGLVAGESGGLLDQRLRRHKTNSPLPPLAIYIGVGVLALLIVVLLVIAFTTGGRSQPKPAPSPATGPRDTSALPSDITPQRVTNWS